jgi:hypothetical protein
MDEFADSALRQINPGTASVKSVGYSGLSIDHNGREAR